MATLFNEMEIILETKDDSFIPKLIKFTITVKYLKMFYQYNNIHQPEIYEDSNFLLSV